VVLGPESIDRYAGPPPSASGLPAVANYARNSGEKVIGSSLSFDRFEWTLVAEQPIEEALAPLGTAVREILAINFGIVGVACAIAFAIARSTTRPILALSDGALRIATGDSEVAILGRRRNDEIGVLARAFHEMMVRLKINQDELEEKRTEIEDANHRLIAQNQELQRVNEVFEQLSITDDLTKLHNHRFFQDHLPREMLRSDRTSEPLSLILFDIDDFKLLNDRHGHSVGDAVLRRVADVMNSEVREMDLLARYGGEEFALLASQTSIEGAVALAEKLRLAVARSRFSVLALDGPSELSVTVSAGVSTYRGDAKAFFNQADRALYAAKEAGKDCVLMFEEDDLVVAPCEEG
jgi:diguanylate cyclase (GGDEF)-like protein